MAASPYQDYAVQSAQKYGVPVDMFLWQIGKESSWNPNAKNPKSSAKGIAQFIDGTAAQFGINALDPYQSLDAAARYDAQLFKQEGTWKGALEKYGTLHDADPETIKEFNNALGENGTQEKGLMSKLFDFSMLGGAIESYKGMTGGETTVDKTLQSYIKVGAFILLGVVLITLAILSNKTVQSAVTKGVK